MTFTTVPLFNSPAIVMATKQLLLILGVMLAFLVCTGVMYFLAWRSVWLDYQSGPPIGSEPLKIKLVEVTNDIPAGAEIDTTNVNEHYETVDHIAIDAYSFASDCIGRKAKWALKKGQYVAKHDLLPTPTAPQM